jgi:hypothetical protein
MRKRASLWLLLVVCASSPARAQDQGLDLLLFARPVDDTGAPLAARAVQIYRLPLSFRLRTMEDGRWGVRLTFPVSLSAVRIEALSDVPQFVKSLGVAAVVPGIELEIPVGERVRLRPFAETGFGKGSNGNTQVLYGSGLRARTAHQYRHVRLQIGGSGMYRKLAARGDDYDGHGAFEAAFDAQVPVGFAIQGSPAWSGVYGIGRKFNGLELKQDGQTVMTLGHQFEAGVSFATYPTLRVWKIPLPWMAVGYQFGPTLSGIRIYTSFPF